MSIFSMNADDVIALESMQPSMCQYIVCLQSIESSRIGALMKRSNDIYSSFD